MDIYMETSNNFIQLYSIPIMYLQYPINQEVITYELQANNYTWKYTNPDGVSSDVIGENFQHPLDNVNSLPQIAIPSNQSYIILFFSSTPLSFTSKYWPDCYAGTNEAYHTQYHYLNVMDNTLPLPKDEMGYIFQVNAIWPQGNANYEFHIIYS
jgi:hypothetical protein